MKPPSRVLPFRSRASSSSGGNAPPGADMLGRGVFHAPFTIAGSPALLAISSTGEKIAAVAIPSGVDRRALARALDALLEIVDPQPRGSVQ